MDEYGSADEAIAAAENFCKNILQINLIRRKFLKSTEIVEIKDPNLKVIPEYWQQFLRAEDQNLARPLEVVPGLKKEVWRCIEEQRAFYVKALDENNVEIGKIMFIISRIPFYPDKTFYSVWYISAYGDADRI
jgi:hypothetical protein